MKIEIILTVTNNSFSFWADLLHKWPFLRYDYFSLIWYMRNSAVAYPVKMEYGWYFWFKVLLIMYTDNTKIFLWNPSMHKLRSFLLLNLQFQAKMLRFMKWINQSENGFAYGGISKRFFLDHFSLSFLAQFFRPKILISRAYSVLSRLWWWLNFSFIDIIHWLWSGHILLLNRIYFAFLLLSDPFLLEPRICCCE